MYSKDYNPQIFKFPCACPMVISSILVRVFTFLSLILCYLYFGTILYTEQYLILPTLLFLVRFLFPPVPEFSSLTKEIYLAVMCRLETPQGRSLVSNTDIFIYLITKIISVPILLVKLDNCGLIVYLKETGITVLNWIIISNRSNWRAFDSLALDLQVHRSHSRFV